MVCPFAGQTICAKALAVTQLPNLKRSSMNSLGLIAAVGQPAEGTVTAGTIGAIFFALMALAAVLLWWNMDRRLARMRAREAAEAAAAADANQSNQ